MDQIKKKSLKTLMECEIKIAFYFLFCVTNLMIYEILQGDYHGSN